MRRHSAPRPPRPVLFPALCRASRPPFSPAGGGCAPAPPDFPRGAAVAPARAAFSPEAPARGDTEIYYPEPLDKPMLP